MIETSEPDFRVTPGGLHVVLVAPEIPQNSGNIARLCAGTGAWLHLVRPLGYELASRHLRRAGLDYWPAVRLSVHESLDAVDRILPFERTWIFTTRATATHTDATYPDGTVLVFGRESTGLPQDWLDRRQENHVRIPMKDTIRSLNLANSVAVAVYEARRQRNWQGM